MKLMRNLKLTLGSLVVAGLAACGGGGGTAASNGSLRLALTDAPSCGYDAVNVTIQKIRVHQSDTANPDDPSGWSEIVLNPALRVDLLSLQNGVLAELGQTPLPVGKYTQLRLVLADNAGATPLANSVIPTGGTEVALKTPSGQQSGLKTNINIDIAADQMADFVLDFGACKSIVVAGSSGQYLLKPVVSVIPRYISGVAGFVDMALASGSTSVSLQTVDGAVIKATTPDIVTGKFLLQPAGPGSYSLVMTAPNRITTVITGVAVASELVTSVNTSTTALSPSLAASATANGTAPEDTLVRVLQPLTGGPTIEVAGGFVGLITTTPPPTGSYSFPLVVNAPMVAPYVAMPTPLVFVSDMDAAGKYTLKASLTGFADKTTAIGPLAASSTVTTNFDFP